MEYSTDPQNNYYSTDITSPIHFRKGKNKTKHDDNNLFKKINKHKRKHKLSQNISPYDVYKFELKKRNKNKEIKNLQSKGRDYKLFVINNETGLNDSLMTCSEYERWHYDDWEEYYGYYHYWDDWYDHPRNRDDLYEDEDPNDWSSYKYDKYMW